MRLYFLLIVVAVTMAFAAGSLSLSLRRARLPTDDPGAAARALAEDFRKHNAPLQEITFRTLFPVGDPATFLDPEIAMPQSGRYSHAVISALWRRARDCKVPPPETGRDPALRKFVTWLSFRCHETSELPVYFFETEPFVDPLGRSYALLAVQAREALGLSPDWAQEHVHLFHVTELPWLRDVAVTLEPQRELLTKLTPDALKALVDNDTIVLSSRHVLYKQTTPGLSRSEMSSRLRASGYAVFAREGWDARLAERSFTVETGDDAEGCVHRDGKLCWKTDPAQVYRTASTPMAVLFAFSLLLAALCLWLVFRELRRKHAEEEKKRFALQTLTHELRTPLSSLVLEAEEAMDHYDRLSPAVQRVVMGMCSDIQRLTRLAEASRQYLTSHAGEALISLKPQSLPVNEYLASVLEPYEGRIELAPLAAERSFTLDPYWTALCLKNLVENALQHGEPPVRVRAELVGRRLEIAVEDAGTGPVAPLKRLAKPFVKGDASAGLGLGLAIVRKVVKAMRAEIELATGPTCFRLRLPEMT